MKIQLVKIAALIALVTSAACGVVEPGDEDEIGEGDIGDNIDNGDGDIDDDVDPGLELAPFDNDSLQSPAESHFLSITGERDFQYTEEVSAPDGDAEDFVEFHFPNNSNSSQNIRIALDCTFDGDLEAVGRVDILEDGVQETLRVLCNEGEQSITIDNTKIQTARVVIASAGEPTRLDYTLTVIGFQ